MELRKDKIHLYSNQVFITDNVENIVPDFLTLLHGVIDSPDIPLNVSRSYLQEDANVKKISGHISKKVSDKLASMFKKDPESFAAQWDDLRIFIEYGMLTDEKFAERAKKFMLFKDTTDACSTYEELIAAVGETQKDKNGKIILPYTADAKNQHGFIAPALERGYKVLVMEGPLASHMVQKLEEAYPDVQFKRVDSDVIENLIETDEATTSALDEKQEEMVKPIIEGAFPGDSYKVKFVAMAPSASPITITRSEFMRRMKEQQAVGGGGFQMFGALPDSYDVAVNSNHPLVQKILGETDDDNKKALAKKAGDLARLSQGLLEGEELTSFIQKGIQRARVSGYGKWIGGAIGWAIGGPIWGILAFTLGKMLMDNGEPDEGSSNTNRSNRTRPGDFSLSLLVLSAAVMKADNRVLKAELDFVKSFLRKNFGSQQGDQLTLMLRDVLKQDFQVRDVADQIRHHMDLSKRLLLLQYLFGIAQSDGQIHTSEIALIREIAGWMAIPAGDLRSIEEMFQAGSPNPYKVLEIDVNSTHAEVKKAYRKLAVKYHPDKVLDLGETHRNQAKERFIAIQNAYEQIKDERGFK